MASTSSESRSRIALVYSVRFKRCRPGAGRCVVAARSSSPSIQLTSDLQRRRIRAPRTGRRHQPRPHFAHDGFGHVDVFGQARQIELIEQQVRGLQPRVVTGDAVLIEQRPLRGHARRRRGCGGSGRRLRRPGCWRGSRGRSRSRDRASRPRRRATLAGDEAYPGQCQRARANQGPAHGEMVTPIGHPARVSLGGCRPGPPGPPVPLRPEADGAIPSADTAAAACGVFRR